MDKQLLDRRDGPEGAPAMELRHLTYFIAVAQRRHFGRAAQALHMAQPPLSRAVRQLEGELGVELLERTTRHVALTPAGQAFYDDAQRILAALDRAVARVRDVGAGKEGLLRIGMTGTAGYGHLPTIARVLAQELPRVALEVETEMLTPAQEHALAERRLDLGVLRLPLTRDDLAHRVMVREPLVVALPAGHALAEAPDLRLSDLRDEGFVMYAAATRSVVLAATERACRAAGFTPRRVREAFETGTLLAYVAAGLGVALVPASVRAGGFGGVVFADPLEATHVDLALAWRADDESPVLARCLEALERHGLFGPPGLVAAS